MKIAIDARIINSSTGRYIERLIHYLELLDKDNEYLILVRKADKDFYKPHNKNFQVIEADFADYSLSEQFGFCGLLNRLNPDLVHFCMPQQPIFYRGLHITTVHDLNLLKTYNSDKNFVSFKFKQLIGRFVFYLIGRTSAHIICPSQYTKDDYARFAHINPDKITVTYEAGGDLAPSTVEPYLPLEGKEFLLYVGQQSDYKNVRRLMQAHQQLRKTRPELLLALVGKLSGKNGVSLQRNRTWAAQQGFTGIIYTDFVSDSQLGWLYKYCATYCFPSLMEGFGLPGLEAMSFGAAVTSSNATCLPEIYKGAAYYFDPYDVADIANAINEVLDNQTLRKQLTAQGKKVVARYSWRHMAEQTVQIYAAALAVKKKTSL